MKRFRLISSIILALIMLFTITTAIFADSPDKPIKSEREVKAGAKVVLNKNTESTYKGKNKKGEQVWEAKITGLPKYNEDLITPINCSWTIKDNKFVVEDNLFDIEVQMYSTAAVITYENSNMTVDPKIHIGYKLAVPKSKVPTIVNDLYNENYRNNTLMWDYGYFKRYVRVIEGCSFEYYVFTENPKADVTIEGVAEENGFAWNRPIEAWDKNNNGIQVLENHIIKASEFNRKELVYPITIDPSPAFVSSASDGYIFSAFGGSAYWSAVHDYTGSDSSVLDLISTGATSSVGVTTDYIFIIPAYSGSITRSYLYFDTSSLGDKTITDATISLWFDNVYASIGAWTLQIQSGMPTYPHDPLQRGDWNKAYYSGSGGTLASASMTQNTYNVIDLNATGISWINQTGTTKFILREKEHDINNVSPANPSSYRANEVEYKTYEQGAGYQPILTVTYTSTAPVISSVAASNVAKTSARLNAFVNDDGGEVSEVRFGYGTTTQTAANFDSYDVLTPWISGYQTNDAPYVDASGLTGNTTYYFRCQIRNSAGTVTSTAEQTFTTTNTVSTVTGLRGFPDGDTINLNWNKADGATEYLVRFKYDGYPSTITDGVEVYTGTANTVTHENIESGKNLYYSVWGKSGTDYSVAPATLIITSGSAGASEATNNLPTEKTPGMWFLATDYTNLSNVPFLYNMINGLGNALGIPLNSFWLMFAVLIGVILAALTYVFGGHSLLGSLLVLLCCFIIGASVKIIPLWMIAFPLIGTIAAGYSRSEARG